jgi:hypothetical protein
MGASLWCSLLRPQVPGFHPRAFVRLWVGVYARPRIPNTVGSILRLDAMLAPHPLWTYLNRLNVASSSFVRPLSTMWPSFHPLFSVAAGLAGNFQQIFNTSYGEVKPLSGNQYAEFIPYIEFARAAYCTPDKIVGWKCGGWSFSSLILCFRILISTSERGLQYPSWLCANVDRW